MFDLEKAIAGWREEMSRAGIRPPDVIDELETHLREEAARLAHSGMGESEAFEAAARELGEGKVLCREFSKVARGRFWLWKQNPLALNLLAIWFAGHGLQILLNARFRFDYAYRNIFVIDGHTLFDCGQIIFWSGLLILMGNGLYQRQNFWRICAMAWASLNLVETIIHFVGSPAAFFSFYRYAPAIAPPGEFVSYLIMGLPVPYAVFYVHLVASLPVLLWGLYILSRPSIRKLFRPATELQTA